MENKSNKIKVSICCMTYNHEKFIEDAIKGFLIQKTNFDYEIVIHDDASTDNTIKIIEKYKKKYPNKIKTIYQKENQYSKSKAVIDFMLPIMKGKYIAFCEGDDNWCDENKLQIQYDYMEKHQKCSFCTHAFNDINENGELIIVNNMYDFDKEVDIKEYLINKKTFQTATIFCRSKYIKQLPSYYYNATIGDLPQLLHLLSNGYGYYINKIMSNYRYLVPGSWTYRNKANIEVKKQNHEMVRNIYLEFNKETNSKYKTEVENYLIKFDFEFAVSINNFDEIFKPKYKKLYKKLPLFDKIKIRIKKSKKIYKLYNQIKYRNKE